MVEAEVQSAMKKKESKLDVLIDSIQQQLDEGSSCEASIKMLQARMLAVAEKAEKALSHLNERSTPPFLSPTTSYLAATPPLADPPVLHSHLEVKNVRTLSETSLSMDGVRVSEFMENTQKQFESLRAENAALKAAFENIRERSTPSPTLRRPSGVIEGLAKLMHIKKEPVDPPENLYSPATAPVKRANEEFRSHEANRDAKRIKSEPVELPYPPLPQLPIPICIPSEAALYSLPPRLAVKVCLITNPFPQLSVVWNVEDNNSRVPPMEAYSVFFTAEKSRGSGIFEEWQNMSECPATTLPMYTIIPQHHPGYKICVAVVGKDKFGRYGPFSKVECFDCD